MADFIECKIEGLDQIQKALQEEQPKKAKAAMRAALKSGAVPVIAQVRADAPKDTGFMDEHFDTKLSIKQGGLAGAAWIGPQGKVYYPEGHEMYAASGRRLVRTGRFREAGAQLPVVSVVRWHEFGWRNRAGQSVPGSMFMSRAFAAKWRTALDVITETLRKGLGLDR